MNYFQLLKNKSVLSLLLIVLTVSFANAANRYSVANGNWNSTTTWSATSGGAPGASVPVAGDNVFIEKGFNVTLTANAACASVTFTTANASSLILGTFQLNVSGAVTIPRSGSGANTLDVGAGNLYAGSIAFTSSGTAVKHKILISTGTVIVSGNVTGIANKKSGTILFSGSGTLIIGGTMFASTDGTLTTFAGSTVEYNGASQTVGDFTYSNLSLSGSGTKGLPAAITINGNLTLSGVAKATTSAAEIIGGNLVVGVGSTFTTGVINSWTLSVSGTTTVNGTLTLNNTGIKTFTGDILNTGTITSGTSNTINLAGNFTNSGIFTVGTGNINVGGNWNNTAIFTAGATCTVIFNGSTTGKTISGTLTGGNGKFNNLIFNGVGGSWVVTDDIDVAKTFTITNGDVIINETLSIASNTPVTVSNNGTLTFENKAVLLQTGYSGINSGNISYKRITPPVLNTDYIYWSSPVSGVTLGGISPDILGGMFFSYDSAAIPEDWKQESPSTIMVAGRGYIIREPDNSLALPLPYTATFTGVPNNGNISVPIVGGQTSNLIGNPYPSAIDADLFLAANSASIDGTLYFWTHDTEINNGQYSDNDYASYNTTGGVAAGGGEVPTGEIASGVAFFATSTVMGGSANFTNAMRVPGNNDQFFKIKKPKAKSVNVEKHRIWLDITNSQGLFKQALVGYISGATNDYDCGFDGESFDGNEFLDFYSVNQDKNLVIQGRALPFDANDVVPLGYRSAINGEFSINIDQTDGLLMNQGVYLEDKLTNTVFDLKSGKYTFNTAAGTFNDRFVLRYTNKTLDVKNFESSEGKALVYIKDKQIKIKSFVEMIDEITVYDIFGRQVYHKENVNSNEFSISNLTASNQALVLKMNLQNGETLTDKIIY